MRYVRLRLIGAADDLHAISRSALPDSVGRGPVHGLDLLEDGSMVLLRSVSGDLVAFRRVLTAENAVRSHSVVGDGNEAYAFLHVEPTDTTRALLRWRRRFPVVVQPPIEFEGEDPVITLVGEVAAFSDATASLPEGLTYEVYETGEFAPEQSVPFRGLTDRQREVLGTAVEMGYYENPRQATQADVADAVSLSPGTVGDHLRTIEAHVFSEASGIAAPTADGG